MSSDKICIICKFYGRISWGNHKGTLYRFNQTHSLNLCYLHAIDLFKTGQINFLTKHEKAFEGEDLWSEPGFGEHRDNYFSFGTFK